MQNLWNKGELWLASDLLFLSKKNTEG